MSIQDIVSIMPPPASPFEVLTQSDWPIVEERLGTALPDDFKEFIEVYGTGAMDKFLWIFNPSSANENMNLIDQAKIQLNVLSELRSYGETVPYDLFPAQGGILPFAITDNGDVLFWQTIGKPNDWTVLVNESRSPDWVSYAMPMGEFLLGILSHRLVCTLFPKSFPGPTPCFEPSH